MQTVIVSDQISQPYIIAGMQAVRVQIIAKMSSSAGCRLQQEWVTVVKTVADDIKCQQNDTNVTHYSQQKSTAVLRHVVLTKMVLRMVSDDCSKTTMPCRRDNK